MNFFFEEQNSMYTLENFNFNGIQDDFSTNIPIDGDHQPVEEYQEEIKGFDELSILVQNVGVIKEEFPFSLTSLDLLNNHGNGFNRLKGERISEPITTHNTPICHDRKKSTEEIMRLAGVRFVHSSSMEALAIHPFQCSLPILPYEEAKDVELVELLLASAEKLGFGNFESARRLLNLCENCFSSGVRNPVQRVVCHFREALKEKIEIRSKGKSRDLFDIFTSMMVPDSPKIVFHQVLPFSQVEKFPGIQAIVEKIGEAKRIHVIDLRIANGVQWTILMQALASRQEFPLELLKITTIGTNSKNLIEETGKQLSNFASTMNIPFCFNIIMVSQISNLKEHLFELNNNEAVAVYSSFALSNLIFEQKQLETLIGVIRGLNPRVMVMSEVEANHNSPNFVNRFVEALFFYGTLFDLIEAFMNDDDENREIIESMYSFEAIRSIVVEEGENRKVRHVKFDVWKAFFERFGMEEIELSQSSIDQANLVLKRFPCGNYCTLDFNGKCLFLCWKGTPLQSLSVWKFI